MKKHSHCIDFVVKVVYYSALQCREYLRSSHPTMEYILLLVPYRREMTNHSKVIMTLLQPPRPLVLIKKERQEACRGSHGNVGNIN
jgi:hypothetical protein